MHTVLEKRQTHTFFLSFETFDRSCDGVLVKARGGLGLGVLVEHSRKACVDVCFAQKKATFTVRITSGLRGKIRHGGGEPGVKTESWPASSPWPWSEDKWRSSPCWWTASPEECSRLSSSAGSPRWMTSWRRRRFLWQGWLTLRWEKKKSKK